MNMEGGMVVVPYNEKYTHCHHCGREMSWGEREFSMQFNPITGEKMPNQKTFGCPRYGKADGEWHDFWWESLHDILKAVSA